MYSEKDLISAIDAGVLSAQTATAFRQHVVSLHAQPAADAGSQPDEENFRLITSFNDIFVVIACALLLISVYLIFEYTTGMKRVSPLAVSVAAWGLAEFFTRKRQMALPSIGLLLTYVGGVFITCTSLSGSAGGWFAAGCGAVTAAAAWLHWRRFHVPITVAAGALAIVLNVFLWLTSLGPNARDGVPAFMLVAGIATFAVAMRWDSSDTLRQTRRSDVAFWLHLVAAPLIVHPVFAQLGIYGSAPSPLTTLVVVGLYLLIALVSLATDRRALMVSALAYVLYALNALLKQSGLVSLSFAFTGLMIGSVLLLLSAFWHPARSRVMGWFPQTWTSRLPSPR